MSDYLASGRLEDHPFADLAGLILRESRSGELALDTGRQRRSVWFLGGNPVAVVSEDPQDHLAQFLLEQGRIGADEARRLAELPETRAAIGGADFLSKENVTWGVKFRFVNLCYDLFRWEGGDYAFHEGDPPRELFLLKVPAHSLVFKGVGFVGQSTIVEAVPDEAVCGAGPVDPAGARYLSPDVRAILEECRPGRTVGDVLGGGWADVDQTRRLLYALACLGLVAFSPAAAAVTAAPGLDTAPGLLLGKSGGEAAAALVGAAPAAPAHGPERLPQAAESGGGLGYAIPRREAEPAAPAGGPESIEFPGAAHPAGGYPYDRNPEAEAPASFGSSLSLEHGDEPPIAPGIEPDRSDQEPGASVRGFRLPRLGGLALGSLAAAALVVGAWWWLNGSEPPPPPVNVPARPSAPQPKPSEPAPPVPVAATPSPEPPPRTVAPASSPEPSTPPVPEAAPTPPATTKAPKPQTAEPPAAEQGTDRYRNGFEVFRAGDLDGAAAIWEALLAEEHRNAYTLLLLTACSGDTVREAQRTFAPRRIYLVSKMLKGRGCFRVCLGTFDSREAAARALAGLPREYLAGGAAVRPVADVLTRDRPQP